MNLAKRLLNSLRIFRLKVTTPGCAEKSKSRAAAGPLQANDRNLLVGKYNNTFDGIIDEVAIYNRVLTEEEIKQDMNKGILYAVSPAGRLATTWARIKRY